MTIEEYRKLLEECIASHILEIADKTSRLSGVDLTIDNAEVNGLCMALRLIGDYGITAFTVEWAHRHFDKDEKWRKALDLSYSRPISRY